MLGVILCIRTRGNGMRVFSVVYDVLLMDTASRLDFTEHTAAYKGWLLICCWYLLTRISDDDWSWLPGDFLDGDIYDLSA